jgi:hypothetical protein
MRRTEFLSFHRCRSNHSTWLALGAYVSYPFGVCPCSFGCPNLVRCEARGIARDVSRDEVRWRGVIRVRRGHIA